MSVKASNQWNAIVKMTLEMLDLAEKAEWEQLAKMDKTRGEIIHQYFSTPVNASESTTVASGIREVLELDNKIIVLCRNQKDKIGDELNKINSHQRATNAYMQNSA